MLHDFRETYAGICDRLLTMDLHIPKAWRHVPCPGWRFCHAVVGGGKQIITCDSIVSMDLPTHDVQVSCISFHESHGMLHNTSSTNFRLVSTTFTSNNVSKTPRSSVETGNVNPDPHREQLLCRSVSFAHTWRLLHNPCEMELDRF